MITVKNLSKHFGGIKAVDGVDLHIDRGSITGLVGPNGAGKTTLFNIITGFINPDAGSIYIDDEDISAYSLHRRSELGLTYLPQEASIFRDLTVYENILSVAELFIAKDRISEKTHKIMYYACITFLNSMRT